MTRWRVTLYNQHAMGSSHGEGRTRRAAFDAAFKCTPDDVKYHGIAQRVAFGASRRGMNVAWLAAFNDNVATMRRGCTAQTLSFPHGYAVEIRRLTTRD